MKKSTFIISFFLMLSMIIISCSEEIEMIQDPNAGDFVVKNLSSNDTLLLSGGINIGFERSVLEVKNGDKVRITFTPEDKYKDKTFETTYKLYNNTIINNQPTYEFEILDTKRGDYEISLYAETTKQSISASRGFVLRVTE